MHPLRSLAVLLPAIAMFAVPPPVWSQTWAGQGRLNGVVEDRAGRPVAGALVVLRPAGEAEGPDPVSTDERGRWARLGLAAGPWEIAVRAEGFLDAVGRVDVAEAGPTPLVRLRLEPLDVVLPHVSEGNPQSVRAWLEKGNALLAQERWGEARAELSRALDSLDAAGRAEAHEAIARTWFMEGRPEAAIASLEEALRMEPGSARRREMYRMLMEDRGRGEIATAFLADLPDGPPELELGPGSLPVPETRTDVLPAEPHRRAEYRTVFPVRLSRDELLERVGLAGQIDPEEVVPAGEELFHVAVPDSYDPAEPWGLLVFVSPLERNGDLTPERAALFARHRLLWVGAEASGNARPKWDRWALALTAVDGMKGLYNVDPDRVFVSGYSGGGRVASTVALLYPEVFRGLLAIYGVDWFERIAIPDHPGAHWPAAFAAPSRTSRKRLREASRLVLVTGERDFNRTQTAETAARMKSEGLDVLYIEIPEATHYTPLPEETVERALRTLEGAPTQGAGEPAAGNQPRRSASSSSPST